MLFLCFDFRLAGAKKSQDRESNKGSDESINNNNSSVKKTAATSKTQSNSLSSARPNRTFELRRARTESVESEVSSVPSTPRYAVCVYDHHST